MCVCANVRSNACLRSLKKPPQSPSTFVAAASSSKHVTLMRDRNASSTCHRPARHWKGACEQCVCGLNVIPCARDNRNECSKSSHSMPGQSAGTRLSELYFLDIVHRAWSGLRETNGVAAWLQPSERTSIFFWTRDRAAFGRISS